MIPNDLDSRILEDIEPIIRGMGLELVELRCVRLKNGAQAFAVIYSPQGVDLEKCSDVLKTIRPRIQMIVDDPDVHIEVSSPGLERVLKDQREYRIFIKRGMRILAKGMTDWIGGVVTEVTEKGIVLTSRGNSWSLAYEDIRKSKLDYTQEVE